MTINAKIEMNKLQYDIYREAVKNVSAIFIIR